MSQQSAIGTDTAPPVLGDGHEVLPVKGTLRRERDDVKPDYPIQPADYPLLGNCICGALIRKEHYITGEFAHVSFEAIVISWARHPAKTRKLAARLASELLAKPRHTPLDSDGMMAIRHKVSRTMVVKARRMLLEARMIYQSGRYYYTGQPK